MRWRIEELGSADVDRVEPLWRAMVARHREVAGHLWPVRDAGEAWEGRRAQYRQWLGDPETAAWLFAATPAGDPDATPLGYAVLQLHEPGPTWALGERMGALESLAVAEDARATGVGAALVEAARATLRERGVAVWSVDVVEANAGAVRFYERERFRPFSRTMLAEVD